MNQKPKDKTGVLRYEIRQIIGNENPTGRPLNDRDLEGIVETLLEVE